jgi:CRISPR-associated endonuclease/helicase Cas3
MTLLAKSDGTTLEDHTSHVVKAVASMARILMPEITDIQYEVATHAAILHDLGKAHPFFQDSLQPGFDRRKYQHDVPHRHELSSLLFLPLFDREEWPQLVDMVVAHHKSLYTFGGKKGRGLIDLVNEYGEDEVFERHAGSWEDWHTGISDVLNRFDIPLHILDRGEIRAAFDEALRLCEQERFGRSRWRVNNDN